MTITLILVLMGLLALLFLIRLAKGRVLPADDSQAGHLRPVDIEAFRNLIDPAETEFLKSHLFPNQFRVIQRERLRAAVEYISSGRSERGDPASYWRSRSPKPRAIRRRGR